MNKRFRMYYQKLGGHIHTRVFGTGSLNGNLVFAEAEWEKFQKDFPSFVFIEEKML